LFAIGLRLHPVRRRRHAASAQDAGWAKIISAAQKEGSVVVSTAATASDVHSAVARSFEKTYGIT